MESKSRRPKPILVSFQNGTLIQADKIKFSFDSESRQLSAESSRLKYLGFPEEDVTHLAVIEKKTRKVQIIEVPKICMKPEVLCEELEMEMETRKKEGELSFGQKNDRVTTSFGSKRRVRAVEARLRNKLNPNQIHQQMSVAMEHAQTVSPYDPIQEAAINAKRQQDVDLLAVVPRPNLEAAIADDVYDYFAIAPKDKLRLLRNDAKIFSEEVSKSTIESWESEKKFGKFILSRLPYLPRDPKERIEYGSCLLFLHHMITMYKASSYEFRKKVPFSKIPKLVRSFLVKQYTQQSPSGLLIPSQLKQRLLANIMLLALKVSDFLLQVSIIQADITGDKVDKLIQLLRSLGCTVTSKNVTNDSGVNHVLYVAELAIPLNFPKPRRGPRSSTR